MTTILRTTLTIALLAACTLATWRTHQTHTAGCANPAVHAAPHQPDTPAPAVKPPDADVPHAWSPPQPPAAPIPAADTSADTHHPSPAAPSG